MELSIIIVSYNACVFLRKALDSVLIATRDITAEVIVIDNNSNDGSPQMVEESYPTVKLIRSIENKGFAAACNIGIESSAGNFILILNPDTIAEPDAFRVCLDFMADHPEAGAVGARMTDGKGRFLPESKRAYPSPMTSFFRFSGLGLIFRKSPLFNRYYLGNIPDNQECKCDILTGAFMFIRREALLKAGLFDTSYFMYGEDIDLSWRIVQAGFTNYYLPDARITHFKGKSSMADNPERIRHFHNAMIIFSHKHLTGFGLLTVIFSVKVKMQISLFLAFIHRKLY